MQETKMQFYDTRMDLRGTETSSLAYYDMGLSTIIGKTDKDAKGQSIDPSVHSTIHRLRTWDHRIRLHNSKDRNLKRAFLLLRTLKDKLNLSDMTIEKTAYIYRKALLKRLIKGRAIESVLVAAAYIAIGETLSSTSLKEISKICNIGSKTIGRMVRLLSSELEMMIPIADPTRCVTKVGNIAGLSEKTKREAIILMSHIKDIEYSSGKKPMGLAAAILYIACGKTGEHVSQKEIAKAAGVTEVTIRTRFRDLKAKHLV
ncbi:MAG: transcription initiation factor IIB [Thermoproteota archaeon]|nr:transcription initiation factor IIB [Thermoproteota archaeon]